MNNTIEKIKLDKEGLIREVASAFMNDKKVSLDAWNLWNLKDEDVMEVAENIVDRVIRRIESREGVK